MNQHVLPSKEPQGYNSWIADHPRQEYQSDLFFFGSQEEEPQIGLIVIDAFTKEITVFLLKNKTPDVILPALEEASCARNDTERSTKARKLVERKTESRK